MGSKDAWISWLLQLGTGNILWYVPWYQMGGVLWASRGHNCVYLLGFTHSTWYVATRVQRQMGIDQTVPLLDGIYQDAPITAGIVKAVLSTWVRDHRLVRSIPDPTLVQTSPDYQHWLKTMVWPVERPRRIALLRQLEGWD